MKKFYLTLSLFLFAQSANAFYTGNELRTKCNSEIKGSFERGECYGFIAGVVEAQSGVFVCLPSGVTLGQVTEMVKKYINENPAQLHKSGDIIVNSAIIKDFPCRKK
jgi:hypothetical protein